MGKYRDLEKRRKYLKEWYQKNKEKILEQQRKYRETHPDKRTYKDRKSKNPEKFLKQRREYMSRYIQELRRRIENLIGNKCILCGENKKLCFHEIYGKNHYIICKSYSNCTTLKYILKNIKDFVPLCRQCHKCLHLYKKIKNTKKFKELEQILSE